MSPPRRRLSFPETASQDIITSARASLNAFGPINTLNVMNNSPQNKENSPLVARKKLTPQLAREQEGFIDVESASRTSEGFGITVSYWRDLESIKKWKAQSEHAAAQRMGRDAFYQSYRLRIARVERDYGFERNE